MVESKDDSTSPALLRVLTLYGGGAKGYTDYPALAG